MKLLLSLIFIVTFLVPSFVLAGSPTLEEYSQTLLNLKKTELLRLQSGEKGVEGYALFGSKPPAYLLTGDVWADQFMSTPSRIRVINKEIIFLQSLLAKLNQKTGDPTPVSNFVYPVADSHVYAYAYRNWNTSNLGKYENLGAGWHPGGGEKRAYLKFDLSNINPGSFEKATLKLFHIHTGGGNAVALGVHRVTSPWVEGNDTYHSGQNEKPAVDGEITWVNQPSFDPTPILGFNPGKGINKWIELDITSLVKAWLSGVPNHGLVIKAQGPLKGKPQSQYGFRSREFKQADKHPVLVLSNTSSNAHDNSVDVDGKITLEPDRIDDDLDTNDKPIRQTKKAAYAQYMAAYNKLTSLMSKGKGNSPAGQRAYQEFKKAKDLYEVMK
ncbi:MAG: DNRLRE domain-containing protein [Hyphomicrobiales bacterium]|nr:DNRLRE domain-containing protein [Hyphomicrobiales bacterium]